MQLRTNCCARFAQPCSTLHDKTRCAAWRFREAASCIPSFISEALHVERQLCHRCSGLCRQLHSVFYRLLCNTVLISGEQGNTTNAGHCDGHRSSGRVERKENNSQDWNNVLQFPGDSVLSTSCGTSQI